MPGRALIVEGGIGIARPPQDVFDVLADPTTWATLDTALVDVEPRAPVAPGMKGTVRRRVGPGMTVKSAWEITDYAPGVRFENLITGSGYELRETVVLAAEPDGTRVSVVDALIPTSLVGRVMVAASGGFIRRDLTARLANLKSLLEAEAGSEA